MAYLLCPILSCDRQVSVPEPGYRRGYDDAHSVGRGGLTVWKLSGLPPFRVVETNRWRYDVEQLTDHGWTHLLHLTRDHDRIIDHTDALAHWLHIVHHTRNP